MFGRAWMSGKTARTRLKLDRRKFETVFSRAGFVLGTEMNSKGNCRHHEHFHDDFLIAGLFRRGICERMLIFV